MLLAPDGPRRRLPAAARDALPLLSDEKVPVPGDGRAFDSVSIAPFDDADERRMARAQPCGIVTRVGEASQIYPTPRPPPSPSRVMEREGELDTTERAAATAAARSVRDGGREE